MAEAASVRVPRICPDEQVRSEWKEVGGTDGNVTMVSGARERVR